MDYEKSKSLELELSAEELRNLKDEFAEELIQYGHAQEGVGLTKPESTKPLEVFEPPIPFELTTSQFENGDAKVLPFEWLSSLYARS